MLPRQKTYNKARNVEEEEAVRTDSGGRIEGRRFCEKGWAWWDQPEVWAKDSQRL